MRFAVPVLYLPFLWERIKPIGTLHEKFCAEMKRKMKKSHLICCINPSFFSHSVDFSL